MGAGQVSLRVLTAEEWAEWRRLRLAALAEAPDAFGSTLAEWSGPGDREDRWRARFENVPFNLLAELDGEPAGMVGASWPEEGVVELLSMWVAPTARGRGVGDALIRAVLDWARQCGAEQVALAVRERNDHAIGLYRRNGFRDAGPSGNGAGTPQAERTMLRPVAPG